MARPNFAATDERGMSERGISGRGALPVRNPERDTAT